MTETENKLILNLNEVVRFNVLENKELLKELLKVVLEHPSFLKREFVVDFFHYSEGLKNIVESIFREQGLDIKYEKFATLTKITYCVQKVIKDYQLRKLENSK